MISHSFVEINAHNGLFTNKDLLKDFGENSNLRLSEMIGARPVKEKQHLLRIP